MKTLKKFKDLSWANPAYEDMWFASYDAPNPRTIGHRIYFPKENNSGHMGHAFNAAYKYGTTMVDLKRWGGFKLLIEHGEPAGQKIGWPHIHVLPVPNMISKSNES